jgi:hypothetical protein
MDNLWKTYIIVFLFFKCLLEQETFFMEVVEKSETYFMNSAFFCKSYRFQVS